MQDFVLLCIVGILQCHTYADLRKSKTKKIQLAAEARQENKASLQLIKSAFTLES
jgi:hypothetical protein